MSSRHEIFAMLAVNLPEVVSESWAIDIIASVDSDPTPLAGEYGIVDDLESGTYTYIGKVLAYANVDEGETLDFNLDPDRVAYEMKAVNDWLYADHGVRTACSLRVFSRFS